MAELRVRASGSFVVLTDASRLDGIRYSLRVNVGFDLRPQVVLSARMTTVEIEYDRKADAAYIRLSKERPRKGRSHEVAPGIILDIDDHDQAVGIEVLWLKDREEVPGEVVVRVDHETEGEAQDRHRKEQRLGELLLGRTGPAS